MTIPREQLFGNPVKAAPKVSPDGRRLAFLAPDEGVLNLWLAQAPRPDAPARPVTKDRGRGIRSYFWASDNEHLVYAQDLDGDENWHLYKVHVGTGAVADLTPFPGAQAHPLSTDPKFPHEMLVSANDRDARLHDVLRVDLRDGAFKRVCENPGDVIGWLPDADFRVRAAKAQRPDGGSELRVRDTESAPWRVLASWGPDDQGGALGWTPAGDALYVETSLGSDTSRLVTLGLDGAEKPVFHDARADLGGAMFHPTDYRLQAVSVEPERSEWTVLDPSVAPDFAALAAACPGDFEVVSRDDADRTWVVFYNNDTRPPCYYLYDRAAKKAEFLFSTRPALEGAALGSMEPVSFPARDGLTLRGYLTLPPAGGKNLPLVLLVHGGPWARDHWGWNPEALWLADRGFAVLRVNFRGSTGYGQKHLHAGDREWGAKMQDDLTDAVAWAVARGVADPARAAIYGGS
ncbi:MAG: peptidase S9 prolyl oligopeptidase, partial [Elusimicrobia bacterium]